MLQSCGGANFSGSTRDRMYILVARAGRAQKRSLEGAIYAHIEYLGNDRRLPPEKEEGDRGSHQLFAPAPLAVYSQCISLRAVARRGEGASVWQFDCKIDLGARNNPPIRSSTDACVQFAFKCREKLALHFVRWKTEREQRCAFHISALNRKIPFQRSGQIYNLFVSLKFTIILQIFVLHENISAGLRYILKRILICIPTRFLLCKFKPVEKKKMKSLTSIWPFEADLETCVIVQLPK